jgi:hypothetical protein
MIRINSRKEYRPICVLLRIAFPFAQIADGLVGILSLTLLSSSFTLKVSKWHSYYWNNFDKYQGFEE